MVQSLSFFIIVVLKSNFRNDSLNTNQFSSYFGKNKMGDPAVPI